MCNHCPRAAGKGSTLVVEGLLGLPLPNARIRTQFGPSKRGHKTQAFRWSITLQWKVLADAKGLGWLTKVRGVITFKGSVFVWLVPASHHGVKAVSTCTS